MGARDREHGSVSRFTPPIILAANPTPLCLSTAAAGFLLLTALVGWPGILTNHRPFLAIYTALLLPGLALAAAPGYLTYKRASFNLPAKLDAQWSAGLGARGRLALQDAMKCCGYFSPFVEATAGGACSAGVQGAVLAGAEEDPGGVVLVLATAVLCANHVTYRFGKGMMPERYRLDDRKLAVIVQEGPNLRRDLSGSDLQYPPSADPSYSPTSNAHHTRYPPTADLYRASHVTRSVYSTDSFAYDEAYAYSPRDDYVDHRQGYVDHRQGYVDSPRDEGSGSQWTGYADSPREEHGHGRREDADDRGVAMCPVDMVTIDGYDCQFGTNVLGHFYLTKLLLPTLLSTAKNSTDGTVRVVNTASSGHTIVDKIDFNTLKDGPARRKMSMTNLYGQSKLGNVLFSNELARRYGDEGIVSTSLNPGNLSSNLYRHMNPIVLKLMNWTVLYPNAMGALTQLYAGTMDGKELNGKYLIPWARVGHPSRAGSDAVLAKALWKWCEEQVEGF
ncbi:hypothetical protein FB107DRAFT_251852 [Schizophyllum commune]